jgi:opine dehydrogenase
MKIAIIGAGNGGQAMAGHFGLLNHEVRIYNRSLDKLKKVISLGGINLLEGINGFGKIQLVSDDLELAINDAELIMVTTTADAHRDLALKMSPFLKSGQTIVLNPGRTLGAAEFYNSLSEEIRNEIYLAEAQSLIYACRADNEGNVRIIGVKQRVMLAAYPSKNTDFVISKVNSVFPCFEAAKNSLVTGLENIGAIFHPTVILFNAATIERGVEFYFYNDMTPSIAQMLENVDKERLMVGEKFGIKLHSLSEWVSYAYEGITGDTLCDKMRNNPAYYKILAPKTLNSRLLFEDVPTGILPIMELGKMVGVETPLMNSIFNITESLLGRKFRENGRTLKNLGIDHLNAEKFINTL